MISKKTKQYAGLAAIAGGIYYLMNQAKAAPPPAPAPDPNANKFAPTPGYDSSKNPHDVTNLVSMYKLW